MEHVSHSLSEDGEVHTKKNYLKNMNHRKKCKIKDRKDVLRIYQNDLGKIIELFEFKRKI